MACTPKLSAIPLIFLLLGSLAGCSSGDELGAHTGRNQKKTAEASVATDYRETGDGETDDSIAAEPASQGNYTKTIDSSGAEIQVKDMALLRSSIASCMGSDLLKVSADMLLPTLAGGNPAPLPDDKVRFLLPGTYAAGDDILEKERGNMVDTSGGARTGVTADGLSDTYLRSLETVANVIAHNCTAANELCKCGDKDQAARLLKRCLPGLDPETAEMSAAAETLGRVCADGNKGMRTAISSLLSSYAFAAAR